MHLIDLTLPLDNTTPIFPGDPAPIIATTQTIEKDGFSMRQLTILTHHGTHIDAPSHMIEGAKHLSDFPLETLIGETIVLDARDKEPDLEQVRAGDIVFFATGKTGKFANISVEIARSLIEKRITIFGLDALTPDEAPYATHKIFLKNDILIVENLTNLEPLIGKRFQCTILPLKLTRTDGAPCRVVAQL